MVGSMVVFEDGLARKGDYRRFVIRGIDGSNDVAAIDEVITRRFRRLLDEQGDGVEGPLLVDPTTGAARKFAYAPGLVVVDGNGGRRVGVGGVQQQEAFRHRRRARARQQPPHDRRDGAAPGRGGGPLFPGRRHQRAPGGDRQGYAAVGLHA